MNKVIVKPNSMWSFKNNLEYGNFCPSAKVRKSIISLPDKSSAWLLENIGDENCFDELISFCQKSFGEKNVSIIS